MTAISAEDKRKIMKFREEGITIYKIADKLNLPRSSVWRFVKSVTPI